MSTDARYVVVIRVDRNGTLFVKSDDPVFTGRFLGLRLHYQPDAVTDAVRAGTLPEMVGAGEKMANDLAVLLRWFGCIVTVEVLS